MNELDEEEFKKYKRLINYITKHNEEEQIEDIQWDNSTQKKTEYKLFKICNSICEKKMNTLELHYWRLIRLYIISLGIFISLKSNDDANTYEIKSIIYKIRYYLDYLGSNLNKPIKDRDIGLDSTGDIYELDENRKVVFDFLYHLPIEAEFNAKVKKKYKLMHILLDLNFSLIDSELLDNKEDILSNLLDLDIIDQYDILIKNLKQYLEFYDDNYKYLMVGGMDSSVTDKIKLQKIENKLSEEEEKQTNTNIDLDNKEIVFGGNILGGLTIGISGLVGLFSDVGAIPSIILTLLGFSIAKKNWAKILGVTPEDSSIYNLFSDTNTFVKSFDKQ